MKLDKKDLKILNLLQENANISNKEISTATHLTLTPVYERIKKLNTMNRTNLWHLPNYTNR